MKYIDDLSYSIKRTKWLANHIFFSIHLFLNRFFQFASHSGIDYSSALGFLGFEQLLNVPNTCHYRHLITRFFGYV